ncbi:TonB-dependent receptor [Colwellia piezophila]|uniref:TonB-dependent receptor n=1 Tax=Colwellia piezophila TaxID=211668 RepID=UPI0012F8B8C7|nr:TonB-dependent receptor [Colwellia piezophila]
MSVQSGYLFLIPYDVLEGVSTTKISGQYTVSQALELMFKDSTITVDIDEHGDIVAVKRASAPLETPDIEIVKITGIRSSWDTSQINKYSANTITESVVAQDTGKFPDDNLASTLKRVSGITAGTSHGAAKNIAVRGFGSQFNLVLMNGRKLASSTITRGFDFQSIPSELVSEATIYKTSLANLPEGGISSTINLETQKPLKALNSANIVKLNLNYEDSTKKPGLGVFISINESFLQDKVGMSLAISHQERDFYTDSATAGSWHPITVSEEQTSDFFKDAKGNGAGNYWRPSKNNNSRSWQQRSSTGIVSALQYADDNIKVTFDTLHSNFSTDSKSISAAYFLDPTTIHNAEVGENNVIESLDYVRFPEMVNHTTQRHLNMQMYGLNIEWELNNNLFSHWDVSYSSSKNKPSDKTSTVVIRGPESTMRIDHADNTVLPVASILSSQTDDGATFQYSSLDEYKSWFVGRSGDQLIEDITAFTFELNWYPDLPLLTRVQVGSAYSLNNFDNIHRVNEDIFFYGGGNYVDIPSNFLSLLDVSDLFPNTNHSAFNTWADFDAEEVIQYLESDEALLARDKTIGAEPGTSKSQFPNSAMNSVISPDKTFHVKEHNFAGYLSVLFETEIANMPFITNLGVRLSKTNIELNGHQANLSDLILHPDVNNRLIAFYDEPTAVNSKKDYFYVLPNLNLRLNITDALVTRFAVSKTLTRPNFSSLGPAYSYTGTIYHSAMNVRKANTELEPYISTNYDFALEWYDEKAGYLSIGLFRKNLDGFIVTSTEREGITIENSSNLTTENIQGNTAYFNVNQDNNLTKTNVQGIELSFQHSFRYLPSILANFGVRMNGTWVDIEDEFQQDNFSNAITLPGLSDSKNIILYYEDSVFEARLAYSSRDEYFSQYSTSESLEPEFVEKYKQLDFRMSYYLNKNTQVFIDGINLTGEVVKVRGRYENQFLHYQDAGRRFSLGIRTKF